MVGELPNHIELIYKNAEDNLRFIKQQRAFRGDDRSSMRDPPPSFLSQAQQDFCNGWRLRSRQKVCALAHPAEPGRIVKQLPRTTDRCGFD